MAKIKGWEVYTEDIWQHKDSRDNRAEVAIAKAGNWYVYHKPIGFAVELIGEFKTKSEAKKKAIAFMKSHPRG